MKNATNLITAENVNQMKFHLDRQIGFPFCCTSVSHIEMVMSLYDYASEAVEMVVYNFIRERHEVSFN